MPYIPLADRKRAQTFPTTAGELNYAISRLMALYIDTRGLSYQHISDCIGALEGAKDEFQQRVVRPYEDEKRAATGPVYFP